MALDKAIKSGKEHRRPYRGGKAVDSTCRNHGGCPWCERNRRHKVARRVQSALDELREYELGILP